MMMTDAGRPRRRGIGTRIYCAALVLCPPAFRHEFSTEMALDVDEQLEEARDGAFVDRLAVSLRLAVDLVMTIGVQWLRTGAPLLIACSVAAAIAATRVAANMLLTEPLPVPASAHDRDLLTLMLLTGTVLLVIAATIVFTFWFCRPVRRHR